MNDGFDLAVSWFKNAHGKELREKRGNGLKFVRSVINGSSNKGLLCYSGKAHQSFGGMVQEIKALEQEVSDLNSPGVLCLVLWKVQ